MDGLLGASLACSRLRDRPGPSSDQQAWRGQMPSCLSLFMNEAVHHPAEPHGWGVGEEDRGLSWTP